jgi:hypothetical protein
MSEEEAGHGGGCDVQDGELWYLPRRVEGELKVMEMRFRCYPGRCRGYCAIIGLGFGVGWFCRVFQLAGRQRSY